MRLRTLALGAIAASMMAIPAVAQAAWGQATGSVNMRTCASTQCQKIGTVPAGAQVWINGAQGGWYNVTFQGRQGFVSGRYVAAGMMPGPGFGPGPGYGPGPGFGPPRFAPPPPFVNPWPTPPPTWGYWRKPRWDNRHNAWYDGRRWYRNGIWFNDPSGFSFGFSFRN